MFYHILPLQSISPGLIKTNIAKGANFGNFFDEIPALEPEDIAEALLYALSTRPEVQVRYFHENITNTIFNHEDEIPRRKRVDGYPYKYESIRTVMT